MKGIKYLLFLIVFIIAHTAMTQSVSSVYSNRGIGLLNYGGLPHNSAMGELGIATPSSWYLNYQNPAFLPLNRASVFQVGLEMDRRSIASSSVDGKKVTGGLRYLNFAFPVINGKWTTSFGITPFSTVNNNTFSVNEDLEIDGAVATTIYTGQGGLTAFTFANGFYLGKNIYFGVRSSFLSGTIEDVENSIIEEGDLFSYNVVLTDQSSYWGMRNELSLGYRKEFTSTNILNLGMIYQISKELTGSRDQTFRNSASDQDILTNERFGFVVPTTIGFGASYQVSNEFKVGSDVVFSNWEKGGSSEDSFVNTTKVSLGGAWTPEYNDVNNYWRRVTYRFGIDLGKLPYEINDQSIREVGINFGASLPIRLSNLDLAFKYGRLGTLNNNLVRENYFRIVIGSTMNDRWFVKRRYD